MRRNEWLKRQARQYWGIGKPVPLPLFEQLVDAGLDVDALERELFLIDRDYSESDTQGITAEQQQRAEGRAQVLARRVA
jgi:hypothetical protein